MCRLFLQVSKNAESAAKHLVSANNSLLAQSINDVSNKPNADGWGISWIDADEKNQMYKSHNPAFLDPDFKHKSKQVKSKVILAHIRRGSIGAVNYNNAHPFTYKNWAFVQNGNIPFLKNNKNALDHLINSEFHKFITGTTDSELFFFVLMSVLQNISFNELPLLIEKLNGVLNIVKTKMGLLDNNKALNFILIKPAIQIGYRYNRHMYYCEENNKIIVASEPINGYTRWKEIADDTFFVIKDADILLFPIHEKNETITERIKF